LCYRRNCGYFVKKNVTITKIRFIFSCKPKPGFPKFNYPNLSSCSRLEQNLQLNTPKLITLILQHNFPDQFNFLIKYYPQPLPPALYPMNIVKTDNNELTGSDNDLLGNKNFGGNYDLLL